MHIMKAIHALLYYRHNVESRHHVCLRRTQLWSAWMMRYKSTIWECPCFYAQIIPILWQNANNIHACGCRDTTKQCVIRRHMCSGIFAKLSLCLVLLFCQIYAAVRVRILHLECKPRSSNASQPWRSYDCAFVDLPQKVDIKRTYPPPYARLQRFHHVQECSSKMLLTRV